MLLRNAMRRPRAVEYGSLSWEDLNRQFRKIFLSGGPYDTGIRGAERLSPVAAAHRILTNSFGLIPFGLYRKEGEERVTLFSRSAQAWTGRPTCWGAQSCLMLSGMASAPYGTGADRTDGF